jgi:E3 ubiquitin-protein ligase UBR1
MKYDREPHLSNTKLGVQIFTTPSIALELVERYHFLTHLLAIEYTYFTSEGSIGRPWNADPSRRIYGLPDASQTDHWLPDSRINDIQHDIHHLLQNEIVKAMIPKRRDWIRQFLMFFELFQGYHAQTRQLDNHREYEGTFWEMAAHMTQNLGRMMEYLFDGFRLGTKEELQWAFRVCLETTFHRSLGMEHENYPNSSPDGPLRWHQVEGHEVVEFEVSHDATSLYCPLHWMLLSVICQIVELDRDAPTDWDEWFPRQLPLQKRVPTGMMYYCRSDLPTDSVQEVMVLACADFPLRALVMAAQIRRNWWARNGQSMLRQYHWYSCNTTLSRRIADFVFLQWAFAVLPPERMLIQMLDRYEITAPLFSPYSTFPAYHCDPEVKLIIHEFFNTFVHLMNERDRVLGESAEFVTRRAIAQYLIFKPTRYSELQALVRHINEADLENHFDTCLNEMAIFHPPTSSKPGTYELKKEYYALVDPRHRTYTRTQTVESERILVEQMAANGVPEPNRIVDPQARVLQPIVGPFAGLTKVLGSRLFCKIATSSLDVAMTNSFEPIADDVLYLCLIAVMHPETKYSFMSNAKLHNHFRNQLADTTVICDSLVNSLIYLLKLRTFSSLHPKVLHLLSKMRPLDPVWFDNSPDVASALSGMNEAIAAAEAERKKLLAKKRRDEALNKMKLAQSKFQESFKDQLMQDVSDEEDFVNVNDMDVDDQVPGRKTFEFPRGNCILCQEKVTESTPYGIPAMVHKHPLSRITPLDNDVFLREAAMTPLSLDVASPRPVGQANLQGTRTVVDNQNRTKEVSEKILGVGFPPQPKDHGYAVTTCSHVLHHKCWVSYVGQVRSNQAATARNHPESLESGEFICPLCKSIANILIPIVWDEGVLNPVSEPAYDNLGLLDARTWLRELQRKVPGLRNESQVNARLQARVLDGDFGDFKLFFGSYKYGKSRREFEGQNRTMYQLMIKRLGEDMELDDQLDDPWDSLPFLLAGTISALEIAQRGTGQAFNAELGPPVLGAISPQELLLLRILALSSQSVLVYHLLPANRTGWEGHFKRHYERLMQLCCFRFTYGIDHELDSLLYSDMFERFVMASTVMPYSFRLSIGQLLLMHYFAEVTKTTIGLLQSPSTMKLLQEDDTCLTSPENVPIFNPRSWIRSLAVDIMRKRSGASDKQLENLYRLVMRYVTPFLRKAVIFVHVSENFIFPQKPVDPTLSENQRLSTLLGLPSIEEIFNLDTHEHDIFYTMFSGWLVTLDDPGTSDNVIKLQHPAVFELIGLPHRLEALLELASKFRCKNCGRIPDQPSMCLFCGLIICTQAMCCPSEMHDHRRMYPPSKVFH